MVEINPKEKLMIIMKYEFQETIERVVARQRAVAQQLKKQWRTSLAVKPSRMA